MQTCASPGKNRKKQMSDLLSDMPPTRKRFTVTTLGCKVNQYESEEIVKALVHAGYTCVDPALSGDKALVDACIINTCTVTQKASMQSRQAIRRAARRHPGALIIVTGCYAQTEPGALLKIEGVEHVVGHDEKQQIPALVASLLNPEGNAGTLPDPLEKPSTAPLLPATGRTRPFLKIQDGCESFCTYCIVPHARGKSRSMAPGEVMSVLQGMAAAGYHETVLTGIHLGRYGLDLDPPTSLLELLKVVTKEARIDRLRLSSIEPLELSAEILELAAESGGGRGGELCRHFHLPLQSGDDAVLKKMNRPYRRDDFIERVLTIKKSLPDAGIGTDVLIGFPGETESAFENTCALIRELPLTYLHVFPFSPREGTPAARFSGRVPEKVIKDRCRIVRELGMRKKRQFLEGQVGNSDRILIENRRDRRSGLLRGLTANYSRVLIDGDDGLMNSIQAVRIEKLYGDQALLGNRIA